MDSGAGRRGATGCACPARGCGRVHINPRLFASSGRRGCDPAGAGQRERRAPWGTRAPHPLGGARHLQHVRVGAPGGGRGRAAGVHINLGMGASWAQQVAACLWAQACSLRPAAVLGDVAHRITPHHRDTPHGALTSVAFMPRNSVLIEVLPAYHRPTTYGELAGLAGVWYYHQVPPEAGGGGGGLHPPFSHRTSPRAFPPLAVTHTMKG